jgi:hypothetical protein
MVASGGIIVAAVDLFDVLQDFGTRPPPSVSVAPEKAPMPETSYAPQLDITQMIHEEVAQAEAATEARLILAHNAALDALKLEHATEIEAMHRRFGESTGEVIAARLGEMENRIGEQASSAAARILGAFLSDELQKRSLDSLAQSIRAAVTDREAVRIKVRGPQSLFETLRMALGDRAVEFDFVEAPGFDLVVSIDGNLFETRLSEWSTILADILA